MLGTITASASLVFLLTVFRVITAKDVSFTFELPDHDKLCFYEVIEQHHSSKTLEYDVIKGGQHDVDVIVKHDGKEVYRKERSEKDSLRIGEHAHGTYEFCFSNEFSTVTHKLVYFELRDDEVDSLAKEAHSHKRTAKTLIEESMDGIHVAVTKVRSFFCFFKN